MKIAIDIRAAAGEKAGKGWYTFNLVRGLLEAENFSNSKAGAIGNKKKQIQNQYILYSKEKIAGFDGFKNVRLKIFKTPGALWHLKVAHDIIREKAEIFFAPSSYIIPAILPKSVKTVITIHDLVAFLYPDSHNKKATIIEKLLLRRALKKAAHVVAVSKNTGSDILDHFQCEAGKISVIHCAAGGEFQPIPPENLQKFRIQTNLPASFFLAVGTLEPRKNYPNLIRAFQKVSKRFPDYHLLVVGKKGWQYGPIYELVKAGYLNKKVHFLNYLSTKSLVNLYNLAHALVFPSFYEGFGMPPLEAMQCGCPVIASHTSSMPEVAGDSALLINPESPDQIADAMIKLIKDPGLHAQLKAGGTKRAGKFSWEKSARELLKIFKKIHEN